MVNMSIKLFWHSIRKEEAEAAYKVLSSGEPLLSGKKVEEFEKEFAKIVGAKYAVSTSSGRAALEACYLTLDPKYGDNVVVPSFTFHATASIPGQSLPPISTGLSCCRHPRKRNNIRL